ncbi:MAG TPA: sigma-54 dependent transcriptional regulator [Bacteroidota bacterium]|nr:sigma-54 dependent transcriptional regulator [Bacteroidota bacterium]
MATDVNRQKLVFIVEDEEAVSKLLEFWVVQRWGYVAKLFPNGESCIDALDEQPDVVLLDLMMPGIGGVETLKEIKRRDPDLPVIMLSAQSNVDTAINTLKLGASDYFSKPIDFPKLEAAVKSALRLREVTRELQQLRAKAEQPVHFDQLVAASGEMREVFKLVHKIKDNDIPVLILGESGTGKELIAQAIHDNGHRKSGPFVVVNCASIPHDLLESELFGHEKGAFTGAVQRRIGRFEAARGGTIFLDEIGELDISLQAKLLRVIQTKRFQRVGGNETIETDARLISATNRDLHEEVKQKRFREDLYFRLATFPIVLPPLRNRKSDILLLAEHFLKKFSRELSKPQLKLSRSAAQLLYEYPWPGNVRELENTLQRAVVMADGQEITEKELPLTLQSFAQQNEKNLNGIFAPEGGVVPMEKVREEAIRHALKVTGGNIAEAASKLKIGRATFYRLLKKYKITV